MKKQTQLTLYVFLIFLSGKLFSQPPSITTSTVPLYQDGKLYFHLKSSSNVVVKNKDTVTGDPGGSFHSLFTKYHVSKTERPYAGLSSGLAKTYRISFTQPTRIDSFLLELSQINTDVDYAEKVPAVRTFSVPNDPVYTNSPSVLYHLPLLNANQASNIHISNGNAIVAIVDNAILTSHDDLTLNIGPSATTWTDVADNDNNPNPPLAAGNASNFAHGTITSGVAGAVTNNSIGIASIGWNNQLMPIKATPDAGPANSITNGYDGIAWAALNGAHVVSMSWGGYAFSQTEYSVVVAAKNLNVVLVAAAGNDATSSPFYPAAYGEGTTGQTWETIDKKLVVAVAGLDQNNDRSIWGIIGVFNGTTFYSGSNYGYWVDISAYGTNIYSTMAASTSTGGAITNQYGQFNGTSMAAPMVSGIAGVMRSYDLSKTADQIIDCLLNTANADIYGSSHPTNLSGSLGYGRADAYAALRCLSSTCSVNPIAIISTSSQSLCPSSTVTLTANQGASYLWNNGATTETIAVNTSGVYNVTVTYHGGCTATASINLPNADLTPHIDILENSGLVAGDGIVCGWGAIQLYAHWGLSYTWSPIGGNLPMSPGGGGYFGAPYGPPFTYVQTVTITGVGGCAGVTGTASALMQWIPSPTITTTSATLPTCPGTAVTITASGANTYTWDASSINPFVPPIPSSTNNPYVAPVDPLVTYTVTGEDSNGCFANQIIGGNFPMVSPYPTPWSAYTLSGTVSGTYNSIYPFFSTYASYIINSDITVSGATTFSVSDLLFGPGVKLIVPSGSTLNILGSHLHTCPNDMWQGIVVQDGGAVNINGANGYSSLIEDAVTSIDITNHATSTLTTILAASSTIFNKNYTDINLDTYQRSSSSFSNAIQISNCVFTCREMAFTSTVWPTTAYSFSTNLRYATSATTALAPPYLGQSTYPLATLKAPYAGQVSRCAIFLNSAGTTTSGITIGDNSNASNFNLFDNHVVFIDAQNSDVSLQNNVYQNQVHALVTPINVTVTAGNGATLFGWSNNSAAVMHRTFNASLNTNLDMSASNQSAGNRFWNCVRAVEGYNMANFTMSNAIARSSHTVDGQNIIGTSGLNLNTNRANYDIHDNEFTNIKNGINVPLTAGYITGYSIGGTPAYGNYLTALSIYNNTFSGGVSSNGNFMTQAVNVTNALGVSPNSPSPLPNLAPLLPDYGWVNNPGGPNNFHPTGLGIINNSITGVFNGINVNGFNGFPVWVWQNTLSLAENTVSAQYGIQLNNGTSNATAQQNVWQNQLQGPGNDGTDVSLIYCSQNSGSVSPLVTCNDVKDATKGFVFAGTNTPTLSIKGTQWLGNTMEDLQFGMYLSGYVTTGGSTLEGVIGPQGDTYVAMGNQWNGSTWNNNNYNLYVYNSTGTNSPLSTLTATNTLNLSGNPSNYAYGSIFQPHSITQTNHNDFFCNFTQYDVQPNPGPIKPTYSSTLQAYLVNAQNYHFLHNNSSLFDANPDLYNWYNDIKSNSNLDALELVQESLFTGNYSGALTSLNSLTAANYVEQNSINFYKLYAKYVKSVSTGTAPYTYDDSLSLVGMTHLCPIEYGSSIYKARALYNTMYNIQVNYENCSVTGGGSRLAATQQTGLSNSAVSRSVSIFPNPTDSKLMINTTGEKDDLFIRIFDLTGRQVLSKQVKAENFTGSLDMDLINGVYMITIINGKDQIFTTKLLIAK